MSTFLVHQDINLILLHGFASLSEAVNKNKSAPCTLHHSFYLLHPTPYTLHPTPYTLHPTPYTLHPTPCT